MYVLARDKVNAKQDALLALGVDVSHPYRVHVFLIEMSRQLSPEMAQLV